MKVQIKKSSDTNVAKFIFTGKDIAVESVLYRYGSYKKRTVICCSTQCGCPVGCSFCGTGKFFKRNLTWREMIEQIISVMEVVDCPSQDIEKFQIMFMSMGEPFLNYTEVKQAITALHLLYPNAQLLISTSAPIPISGDIMDDFISLSNRIPQVGLQFSLHESLEENRKKLIPTKTASPRAIAILGEQWARGTGRKPFFNYCVHEGNSTDEDIERLKSLFNTDVWEVTLSVICEKDSTMKAAIEEQLELIQDFSKRMVEAGFSVRVFNPAGQDDIGGGCGQLWYFQEWAKKNK